jgi:hypothetical protein
MPVTADAVTAPPTAPLIRLTYASADFKEGMSAFLEKRTP